MASSSTGCMSDRLERRIWERIGKRTVSRVLDRVNGRCLGRVYERVMAPIDEGGAQAAYRAVKEAFEETVDG